MNTQKKKNKNRPKSQNPLPPQNVEGGEKVAESASVVDKPEIQVKTEERVPEILSEVVTAPVGDTKEGGDNDSPKKPKRNRGKKKKGDKVEPGDNAERKISTGEAADDVQINVDVKVDYKAIKPQEVTKSDDSNISMTPTSRKKKVKNKGQESIEKVPEVKSDILESKNEPVFEKECNLSVSELQEQESKSAKKKNKKSKKNRNDSEKNDDSSCTSASQKITKEVTESEVKNEGVTLVEGSLNESTDVLNAEIPLQVGDTQKDEGSKNKKKIKKDKKHPSKEEEICDVKLTPTQLFNISQDVKPMTFVMELPEDKDEIIEIRDEDSNIVIANADVINSVTVPTTKEPSPKPKAKIAKPVEKKGKDKKTELATKHQEEVGKEIPPKEKDQRNKTDATEEEEEDDMIMSPITDDSPEDKFVEVTKKKDKGKLSKAMIIKEDLPKHTETKEMEKVSEVPSELTITKDSEVDIKKQETLPTTVKTEETSKSDTDVLKQSQKKSKKGKQSLSEVEEPLKADNKEEPKACDISLALILNPSKTAESPTTTESSKEKSIVTKDPPKTEETEIISTPVEKSYPKKGPKAIPMPDFVTDMPLLAPEEPEKILPIKTAEETKVEKAHPTKGPTAIPMPDFATKMPLAPEEPEKIFPIKSAEETKVEESHPKNVTKAIPMPDFATNIPLPSKEPEIILPVKSAEVTNICPESVSSHHDNITIPEQETGKKRKKSPKPSRKPESDTMDNDKIKTSNVTEGTIDLNILEPNLSKTTPPIEKKIPDVDESKMETKPDLSSIKIETTHIQASAQTPMDITPDMIESPRSTSADIIDSNNNMMIQEINTPSTLTVPIVMPETPMISGSGKSPEVMSQGIKLTEPGHIGSPLDVVEKTDVKSKMMEVNQDMEDLRLSIERSLAELTALEKKDEEFGIKPFETKIIDTGAKKETLHPLTPIQETEIPFKVPSDFVREPKSADIMLTKTDVPKLRAEEVKTDTSKKEYITKTESSNLPSIVSSEPPVCPSRKDNKGKNKSKKMDKQATNQPTGTSDSTNTTAPPSKDGGRETKKEEKSEQHGKTQSQEEKGKKQTDSLEPETVSTEDKPAGENPETQFDPIENFEDAMTSSADDVNKSFEIIANESSSEIIVVEQKANPEINVTDPDEVDKEKDKKHDKINPIVSQPKNLLGHPVIPARSSKMDYKKEKNKAPNLKQAKVKIKDANDLEKTKKESKESQTENKPKLINNKGLNESVTCVTSENDEYVYKYSFRKVFLSSNCHVCKKELNENRIACNFCNIMLYCSKKHKDDDFPQHQAFCFAVSTICHLKGQKHIYAETKGVTGHEYRLLRMQLIVSCERILKRKLAPSEQEALLYPRVCADGACREWRAGQLKDCDGCGQVSYCTAHPEHLPKTHPRWCKPYALYQRLVVHQLTRGRLEPPLPAKLLAGERMPSNINRLLADMYHKRIDMNDIQYAALTQLATAPLTAAFSHQLYRDKMKGSQPNGLQKSPTLTVHVVGAELQFEADSLHKWEVFFLHLRPDVLELRLTLVGPELNPSNLPLELLGNIKLCPSCRVDRRRVVFEFQDKLMYHQYRDADDFAHPDLVCAFNPSIHRSASYSHSAWASILDSIFRLKAPFCVTAYSMSELQRDLAYIKTNTKVDFSTVSEPKFNPFASVRPDRNFITDDEIPLLFKNYCYSVLVGAF